MSFFKKSVDTITSKLSSTVAELEAHAEKQLARAATEKAKAAVAAAAHRAHTEEHALALKVAGNIKALLGG